MTWVDNKGKEQKNVYSEKLYNHLTLKRKYRVFTTMPAPFKCCSICMYAVPHLTYNIFETRPFEQVVEDLPF